MEEEAGASLLASSSSEQPGHFSCRAESIGFEAQSRRALGPMQTQQLSEAKQGRFQLVGLAGNSAPDHVDQLHSLSEYLRWLK